MLKNKLYLKAFTLIEVMVVICIIGISATVIYLRYQPHHFEEMETFTQNLKERMDLIHEQAIQQRLTYGFVIKNENYAFYVYDNSLNKWTILKDDFWKPFSIPQSIILKMNSKPTEGGGPAIVFYPSGEMTPFKIIITQNNSKDNFTIIGESDGTITTQEHKT